MFCISRTALLITHCSLLITLVLLSACAPDAVRRNEAGNKRFSESAYDEAIVEYRQAQVDEPDRAEPYYNAANAYNRQGQLDPAQAQAQQALKNADDDLSAKTWYNLGNAHFDAEAWPEAIAAYQEALRIDPSDADAKHNLELALQKLEQQQQEQAQQDQQDQEQNENQEGQQSEPDDQSEASAPTPTPGSQPETQESQNQTADEQEAQGMTSEQAMQLLQALLSDAETLQERLQEIYRVPGPPPDQDW